MPKTAQFKNILSPAKINLVLRVGPRRRDGYHELETLMVPVKWGDQVSIRLTRSEEFKCQVSSKLRVSLKRNLVYRAAESFSKHFKLSFTASITLKKNIPTGAGLGGGSGNAATILQLLSKWAVTQGVSRSKLNRDLPKLAARLGADVPFFLLNSAAWCTGFGEKCKVVPTASLPIVIVMPSIKIPTPWAYGALDLARAKSKVEIELVGKPMWLRSPFSYPLLQNDFEAIALKFKPQLTRAFQALAITGALAARMSGSGSAFFGIYPDASSARRAAIQIRRQGMAAVDTMTS